MLRQQSDQVRSVMFTTGWFRFKYSRFMSTACLEVGVLVLSHDKPGSSSRQDGYSVGDDRKCV